jgi:hypothetical protein
MMMRGKDGVAKDAYIPPEIMTLVYKLDVDEDIWLAQSTEGLAQLSVDKRGSHEGRVSCEKSNSPLFVFPLVPFDAHFQQLSGSGNCKAIGEELMEKIMKYFFRVCIMGEKLL